MDGKSRVSALLRNVLGQAAVDELGDEIVGDDHVGALHVAVVRGAAEAPVHEAEGSGCLQHDAHAQLPRQQPGAAVVSEHLVKTTAGSIFINQAQRVAGLGSSAVERHAVAEESDDVRVVERAQNVDLTSNGVGMRLLRSRSAGSGGGRKLLRVPFHGQSNAGFA